MESVQKDLQSLTMQLHAIGNQVRLDILRLLVEAQGPLQVVHVVAATHYLQPRVSRHLHWLVAAGLVEKQAGVYSANRASIEELFVTARRYTLGDHEEEKR